MGGRGQFSENKFDGVYEWYTVRIIIGKEYAAKILDSNMHNKLPEESHTENTIYARYNDKGTKISQVRIYENHIPVYDIDITHEHSPFGKPHVHKYENGKRIAMEFNDHFKDILDDLGIDYDKK